MPIFFPFNVRFYGEDKKEIACIHTADIEVDDVVHSYKVIEDIIGSRSVLVGVE